MQHSFAAAQRARTPDPPSGWVAIEPPPNPSMPHLPLPLGKSRNAFAMSRNFSDDHHERRRESKLGFGALSGLAHSHTMGHSKRKPRTEYNGHARHPSHVEHNNEHHEDIQGSISGSEGGRDREHGHGLARLLRLDDENHPKRDKENARTMHHKFASEGWPTEDDGGSKLGRRISTLRGSNGISSWRSMGKQVSAAAHKAAESLRAPDVQYAAGGGRHPIRSGKAPSAYAASVAPPSAVDLTYIPGGGRHPQRSNYPASLAPSRPHTPPFETPPPLPTMLNAPTCERRPSYGSTFTTATADNASLHAQTHHTPSFASSSSPSVAPTASTASDAGSDGGPGPNYVPERRTSSARNHTLSHVRNSGSSVHHYVPSEASLASSPGSVISPLSPVTPRSPYGPCVGGWPGKHTMSRTFRQPNIDEVLPFASSPFSAWDPIAINAEVSGSVKSTHASAAATAAISNAASSAEGWRDVRAKGAAGSRRVWHDPKGKEIRTMYKVGWERDVLDLEGRLHETMYELAGGRHSFADGEPATVLDVSAAYQDSAQLTSARYGFGIVAHLGSTAVA